MSSFISFFRICKHGPYNWILLFESRVDLGISLGHAERINIAGCGQRGYYFSLFEI